MPKFLHMMETNVDGTAYHEKKSPVIAVRALPATADLTGMFKHGGIHSIGDKNAICERIKRMQQVHPRFLSVNAEALTDVIYAKSQNFFYRLANDEPYNLNSSLISHISLYSIGRAFSQPKEEILPNNKIPTFLTFVGQFIDHDLTLNMIDLIGRAGNDPRKDKGPANPGDPNSKDIASPFIDLDNVYGTRTALAEGKMWQIYDIKTGKFILDHHKKENYYDFCRVTAVGTDFGKAYINDMRNDENRIISQIHLLIERLHNTLASDTTHFPPPVEGDAVSVTAFIDLVRNEVVRTWQSFLWNEYLPKLIYPKALNDAKAFAINGPVPIGMPHEFSIGFRMGHSQLRPSYRLNQDNKTPILLFANQVEPVIDLRGSRPLIKEHVIDWDFFLKSENSMQTSNKIDGKVTSVVFDLPEPTIPDNVKGVGNLPQRNLIRSEQVQLTSGENVLKYINKAYQLKLEPLTKDQIEPDPANQMLFMIDNNGQYFPTNEFRTPLWYYILKEAELTQNGEQLGDVGGRIIGQVIAAGIYHTPYSFNNPKYSSKWKKLVPTDQPGIVNFIDIVKFVKSKEADTFHPDCSAQQ